MKNTVKYARLAIQVTVIILQVYFFVEIFRLYSLDYVVWFGEPIENTWSAMHLTLILLFLCEFFSLFDAVLLFFSKQYIYSGVYLAIMIVNGVLFCNLAYYSVPGTVFCIAIYAVILIIRIVNLILNLGAILIKKK